MASKKNKKRQEIVRKSYRSNSRSNWSNNVGKKRSAASKKSDEERRKSYIEKKQDGHNDHQIPKLDLPT